MTAAILLDTDVASFLFKKDTRGRFFRRHLPGQEKIVSFMTVAELDQWATKHRWGQQRRDALERFLQGYRVHYADRDLCRLWAAVMDGARRPRPAH